jgi:hypothetical protein
VSQIKHEVEIAIDGCLVFAGKPGLGEWAPWPWTPCRLGTIVHDHADVAPLATVLAIPGRRSFDYVEAGDLVVAGRHGTARPKL